MSTWIRWWFNSSKRFRKESKSRVFSILRTRRRFHKGAKILGLTLPTWCTRRWTAIKHGPSSKRPLRPKSRRHLTCTGWIRPNVASSTNASASPAGLARTTPNKPWFPTNKPTGIRFPGSPFRSLTTFLATTNPLNNLSPTSSCPPDPHWRTRSSTTQTVKITWQTTTCHAHTVRASPASTTRKECKLQLLNATVVPCSTSALRASTLARTPRAGKDSPCRSRSRHSCTCTNDKSLDKRSKNKTRTKAVRGEGELINNNYNCQYDIKLSEARVAA